LNSSRSNNYKLASGKTVPYNYTFSITVDPAGLTADDRKKILAQACSQAEKDIAQGNAR